MATYTEEITESKIKYTSDDIYGRKVVLYNDDHNNFDHVEECLIRICFKNKNEAKKIAMEAHTKGRAICYKGSFEECETVAERMGEQNLTVSME